MTRDELNDALTVERFGPLVPPYTNEQRNYDTEIAAARAEALLRRYELNIAIEDDHTEQESGAANGPDPNDQAELLERPGGGIVAA